MSRTKGSLVYCGHQDAGTGIGEEGGGIGRCGNGFIAVVVDLGYGDVIPLVDRGPAEVEEFSIFVRHLKMMALPWSRSPLLIFLLNTQSSSEPAKLGAVDLDGPLYELGLREIPLAVVERPNLQGVLVNLLVPWVRQSHGDGEQKRRERTLEAHCEKVSW